MIQVPWWLWLYFGLLGIVLIGGAILCGFIQENQRRKYGETFRAG